MSQVSLFHYQDQYQKGLCRRDVFVWDITAAVTASLNPPQSGVLTTFGALTQATIDAFLGSTTEINALAYDATSMGADAMGAIFNYNKQVQSVSNVVCRCFSASDTIVTRQVKPAGLTNTSLETAAVVTSLGNIGLKINWGDTPDFDALTAGLIEVTISWVSK